MKFIRLKKITLGRIIALIIMWYHKNLSKKICFFGVLFFYLQQLVSDTNSKFHNDIIVPRSNGLLLLHSSSLIYFKKLNMLFGRTFSTVFLIYIIYFMRRMVKNQSLWYGTIYFLFLWNVVNVMDFFRGW